MIEYELISNHYGDRVAKRSGVRLMNHIDEGLVILQDIGTTDDAMRAFCLHPLLQNDGDLSENYERVTALCSPRAVALAMEYRNVSNRYLSQRIVLGQTPAPIELSPLNEVNDMLVADKVQNFKDFMKYHYGKHPRSTELLMYFSLWIGYLGLKEDTISRLINKIT